MSYSLSALPPRQQTDRPSLGTRRLASSFYASQSGTDTEEDDTSNKIVQGVKDTRRKINRQLSLIGETSEEDTQHSHGDLISISKPSDDSHISHEGLAAAKSQQQMDEEEASHADGEDALESSSDVEVDPMQQSQYLPRQYSTTSADTTQQTPNDTIVEKRTLASKLQEIFALPVEEEVVREYPCWLLRSILLQGYMYLTRNHICFYAYLPRKEDQVLKSGYLAKRSKNTRRYWRYWFVLKNDVLSYYENSTDLYFPLGNIDLRYAIDVEPSSKPNVFKLMTTQRQYYIQADSETSMHEWIKTMKKVLFRSKNEGDSVKIAIPLENVLEIEENASRDFADTIKVKVVDNEETYVIDEYYFAYFNRPQDAFQDLTELVQAARQEIDKVTEQERGRALGSLLDTTALFNDHVDEIKTPTKRLPGSFLGFALTPKRSRSRSQDPAAKDVSGKDLMRVKSDTAEQASRKSIDEELRDAASDSLPHASTEPPMEVADKAPEDHSIWRVSDWVRKGGSRVSNILSTVTPDSSNFRPRIGKRQVSETWGSASDTRISTGEGPLSIESNLFIPSLAKISGRRTKQPTTLSPLESKGTSEGDGVTSDEFADYKSPTNLIKPPLERSLPSVGVRHALTVEAAELEKETEQMSFAEKRFRIHYALPDTEQLTWWSHGYLTRMLPIYGKIYISEHYFCFRSTLPGIKTKMMIPLSHVLSCQTFKSFRFGYYGLVVIVKGYEELFVEFGYQAKRDECLKWLEHNLNAVATKEHQDVKKTDDKAPMTSDKLEDALLAEEHAESHKRRPPPETNGDDLPAVMFRSDSSGFINFRPTEPLHITCLTIGSRGDVQPYIALAKGLIKEGHRVRIATHGEFKDWIEGHGIEYAYIGGDPAELMRICVENGMFTVSFLRESISKFRGWMDDLLKTAWEACQGTDLLIESPSAMGGIHIAEALRIPYFRAFTMPWTRTRAYPHAFAVPDHKMGGSYNYFSYVMFDQVFWRASAPQINRWRKKTLGLSATNLEKLEWNKVPFLYNFSPSLCPPPADWAEWIRVTGYWFLDSPDDSSTNKWQPPDGLADFMERAKTDGKKLVYIGFGSIVVSDPDAMTRCVLEATVKADVRVILSKGWSDRLSKEEKVEGQEDIKYPPEIFNIDKAPHDWLFARIDAACHHGGAGTTGASLRAGIPTLIKPFFGDQYFWGDRVEAMGIGVCLKKLTVDSLTSALNVATQDERMIERARRVGEKIRDEDGVATAIQAIYRDLEYAKSLVKQPEIPTLPPVKRAESEDQSAHTSDEWSVVEGGSGMSGADSDEGMMSPTGFQHITGPAADLLTRSPTGIQPVQGLGSGLSPVSTLQSVRSNASSPGVDDDGKRHGRMGSLGGKISQWMEEAPKGKDIAAAIRKVTK